MLTNHEAAMWENVVVDTDLRNFLEMREKYGTQTKTAQDLGLYDNAIISKIETGKSVMDKRTFSLFLLLTGNHPHYELKLKDNVESDKFVLIPPDGEGIRKIRQLVGITQGKMAFLAGLMGKGKPNRSLVANYENNRQSPNAQTWTVFLLAAKQHPYYELLAKS